MRVIARVASATALALIAGLVVVATAWPLIEASEAVHQYIRDVAKNTLGHQVEFAQLDIKLLPLSLVLEQPVFGAADSKADPDSKNKPPAQAQRLSLTISPMSLLARSVIVDSAIVERARFRLVRTGSGVRFALPPPRSPPQLNWAEQPVPTPITQPHAASVQIVGFYNLEFREASIVVDDYTQSPPVHWELQDIGARVHGDTPDARLSFEFAGDLSTGGRLAGKGAFNRDGFHEARVTFESFAIEAAKPYFSADSEVREIRGALSGSISGKRDAANTAFRIDATLHDGHLQLGEIALRGPLVLEAALAGHHGALRGRVALDATHAELRYGGFFTKPPGTSASVEGHVTTNADGTLGIDEWKFVMRDLEGQVAPAG